MQDTVIIPATVAINNDKTVFSHPEQFDPENFLDKDGNLKNMDKIFPFGTGMQILQIMFVLPVFFPADSWHKQTCYLCYFSYSGGRRCTGQPVAEVIIFIFIASILRSYKITAVPEEPTPTTKLQLGFTMRPYPYNVLVQPRTKWMPNEKTRLFVCVPMHQIFVLSKSVYIPILKIWCTCYWFMQDAIFFIVYRKSKFTLSC